MSKHSDRRSKVLQTAEQYVNKDRNTTYSEPTRDFENISAAWQWWLDCKGPDHRLDRTDVAAMMVLMKLSRISGNPSHEDSWIDIAGYAACGFDCAMEEKDLDDRLADLMKPFVQDAVWDAKEAIFAPNTMVEWLSDEAAEPDYDSDDWHGKAGETWYGEPANPFPSE